MPRRQEHNIESNCVTFEDDCYNETQNASYEADIAAMDKKEMEFIQRSGQRFVNYLTRLLQGN